jgi:protein O-mannosyl-transferase
LGVYFLSDDFILVRFGSEWTAAAFRYAMTHGGGDGFFRPLGYASLALDARLSGSNPMGWHAISLAIHSANAVLVLLMARRLGASMPAAGFAGALFAVHGIHPEAVVWIAGRFDLVATFFLLAGLLLFTMTGERNRVSRHAAALACVALAALTKEAAFIFPLLVAGYALAKRQSLRPTAWYFALAAILFAYRWTLFGGIGGYVNPATGRPAALSLGWGSTLKAVAVRLWTSLYFPLNWSTDASVPLALLAVVYIAAILWLAARSRPARMIWLAAASILMCTIPVLSLLAGSPALAGSRVLYLPSVWFAILLALAVDGVPGRVRYVAAAVVLLFQFAMLQHNLGFWERASSQVKAACATGAPALPDSIDGVPALANGRQECIQAGRNGLSRP